MTDMKARSLTEHRLELRANEVETLTAQLVMFFEELLDESFHEPFNTLIQDGVVLCRAYQALYGKASIKFNQKPKQLFHKNENLTYFVKSCEKLGIRMKFDIGAVLTNGDPSTAVFFLREFAKLASKEGKIKSQAWMGEVHPPNSPTKTKDLDAEQNTAPTTKINEESKSGKGASSAAKPKGVSFFGKLRNSFHGKSSQRNSTQALPEYPTVEAIDKDVQSKPSEEAAVQPDDDQRQHNATHQSASPAPLQKVPSEPIVVVESDGVDSSEDEAREANSATSSEENPSTSRGRAATDIAATLSEDQAIPRPLLIAEISRRYTELNILVGKKVTLQQERKSLDVSHTLSPTEQSSCDESTLNKEPSALLPSQQLQDSMAIHSTTSLIQSPTVQSVNTAEGTHMMNQQEGLSRVEMDSDSLVVEAEIVVPLSKVPDHPQSALDRKQWHSDKVRQEIMNTESDYVRDLHTLVEEFLTLLQESRILSAVQINDVFPEIRSLYNLHSIIFEEFARDQDLIGSVIVKYGAALKMYSTYCAAYDNILVLITKLRQSNASFRKFLKAALAKDVCRGLDITSFLIKPVQRICKYPLLFKELLKYTDSAHPDHANLESALSIVQKCAEGVNQKVKEMKNNERLMSITSRLEGYKENLLTPTRRYIMDSPVRKFSEQFGFQHRRIILFNDMILLVKDMKGHSYKYKENICLQRDYAVREYSDPHNLMEANSFGFEIIQKSKNLARDDYVSKVILFSYTGAERAEIMQQITYQVSDMTSENVSGMKEWKRRVIGYSAGPLESLANRSCPTPYSTEEDSAAEMLKAASAQSVATLGPKSARRPCSLEPMQDPPEQESNVENMNDEKSA
eukprot:TRINITY_DN7134_c0_g2_i5.p1 TRINITY_DN7134_c0_g2~~TRINITY_DN7134_c0_g2_i5.p1  ORF type:complete len:854 (+),score=154.69 TRINITY_DN7134_c0_g2_i5:132-2693(+)